MGTLPYMEMQKVSSQDSTGQMRGGSNSAPRSNVPFGTGMGYQQPQQSYYNGIQPYGNQGPKMGSYDNRSHSPYHHNKPYSQNYGNRPHNGGYYNGPQDRGAGYGGGYGEQMMGNNPRQGYNSQQMGNRPHNPSSGYNKYDYPPRNQPGMQNYPPNVGGSYPPTGPNYPPGNNYPQFGFSQGQEDELQFNDAILLVRELKRGVLP